MQSNSIWGWRRTTQPSLKPASVIKNDKRNRVRCWRWSTIKLEDWQKIASGFGASNQAGSGLFLAIFTKIVPRRLACLGRPPPFSYEWIWITLGWWNLPSSAICFPSSARKGSDRIKNDEHENLFRCFFRILRSVFAEKAHRSFGCCPRASIFCPLLRLFYFHCCRLPTFSPNKAKGTTMEIKTPGRRNIKKDFIVVAAERAVRGWPREIWCLHSLVGSDNKSFRDQAVNEQKESFLSTNKKWNDEGLKVQSPGGSDKDEIGRERWEKGNLWGCEFSGLEGLASFGERKCDYIWWTKCEFDFRSC